MVSVMLMFVGTWLQMCISDICDLVHYTTPDTCVTLYGKFPSNNKWDLCTPRSCGHGEIHTKTFEFNPETFTLTDDEDKTELLYGVFDRDGSITWSNENGAERQIWLKEG